MANSFFKRPNAGMNVQQAWPNRRLTEEKRCTYEDVTCPACTRVHFINSSTGEVLARAAPPEAAPTANRQADRYIGDRIFWRRPRLD
jgi:hypothetical protein